MAAALTRKVPGLLRPLVVCTGAPKLCLFSPVTRPPTPTLRKPCTPVWASMSARSVVLKLCNFKDPQFSPIRATDPRNSHLAPFAHSQSYRPLRRFHSVPDYQWNPRNPLKDPWGSPPVPAAVLSRRVSSPLAIPGPFRQPIRSLTYYSVKKAKRKSVESVKDRFLRLHCGLWVRRQSGYKKKLWRKPPAKRSRLRQHVFCNKTQSKLLDKMTTAFWKRRNWYLDDPYMKYHDRVNLQL